MMSYEEFLKEVENSFISYMPSGFKDYKVVVFKQQKVNEKLDALRLELKDNQDSPQISPVIFVNALYEEYEKSGDFKGIMHGAAEAMTEAFENPPINNIGEFIKVDMNNLFLCLINTRQNEELLKTVPHRDFMDLSIIYKCIVHTENNDLANYTITNKMLEKFEISEQELYDAALADKDSIMPTIIIPICDITGTPSIPGISKIYIITNDNNMYGAAFMVYVQELERVADLIGSDFYILPSSLHECIAISANCMTPDDAANMVRSVNEELIAPEERLSNQVYQYDREQKRVFIASSFEETEKGLF